jgi:hypothetical protein
MEIASFQRLRCGGGAGTLRSDERRVEERMSEVSGTRNARGDWQPAERVGALPIWTWPPQPLEALKWVVGNPGYLFPWYAVYFVIAVVTWAYLTPEMARMVEFRAGWIAEVYVRNLGLLVLWAGGWHVRLYRFKSQGTEHKFSHQWLHGKSPTFLWGSQLRDNVLVHRQRLHRVDGL